LPSKVTDDGVAAGAFEAPGQPTDGTLSLWPAVHEHEYVTDVAPPVAVSVTVHVLPVRLSAESCQLTPATVQPVGVVDVSGVPFAVYANVLAWRARRS
jgi:hypothetical protein